MTSLYQKIPARPQVARGFSSYTKNLTHLCEIFCIEYSKLAVTYFAYGDGTPFTEAAQGLATVSHTVSPSKEVPSVQAGFAFK